MSTNTIDTEKTPDTAKKARQPKKAAGKRQADRSNKKAEVIALIKRAKGATLAEIMAPTGWQAHTVRGFVSILGSKGREKIESSKVPQASARTRWPSSHQRDSFNGTSLPVPAGAAFPACIGHIDRQVT
jgi:hypothetical protein